MIRSSPKAHVLSPCDCRGSAIKHTETRLDLVQYRRRALPLRHHAAQRNAASQLSVKAIRLPVVSAATLITSPHHRPHCLTYCLTTLTASYRTSQLRPRQPDPVQPGLLLPRRLLPLSRPRCATLFHHSSTASIPRTNFLPTAAHSFEQCVRSNRPRRVSSREAAPSRSASLAGGSRSSLVARSHHPSHPPSNLFLPGRRPSTTPGRADLQSRLNRYRLLL